MADESYLDRVLYLRIEAAYAEARGADSEYFSLPASGTLEASGGRSALETNRFTGRPGKTALKPGASSASGSFGLELLGLSTQGGIGASPVAQDHLDKVLSGFAAGTPLERDGLAVSTLSTTALDLGSDGRDAEDLVCLVDGNGVVRWASILTDATDGTYTLKHAIPDVGGSAFAPVHARATRQWNDANGNHTSNSFGGVYVLGGGANFREIPGLRIGSASMAFSPNALALMTLGFEGDDFKIPTTAPVFTTAANGDPADTSTETNITGCVYIDGVLYQSAVVNVDWQLQIADRQATCTVGGRVNKLLIAAVPRVTLTTPFLDTWDTVARNLTVHDVKVVSGVEASDGPSTCLWVPNAQLVETPNATDDNGFLGQSLTFDAITVGTQLRWAFARS